MSRLPEPAYGADMRQRLLRFLVDEVFEARWCDTAFSDEDLPVSTLLLEEPRLVLSVTSVGMPAYQQQLIQASTDYDRPALLVRYQQHATGGDTLLADMSCSWGVGRRALFHGYTPFMSAVGQHFLVPFEPENPDIQLWDWGMLLGADLPVISEDAKWRGVRLAHERWLDACRKLPLQ